MPAESMLLNLPPWLRAKTKYIMLHFLMPSTLKERAQKKYFDYMITMDLNPLATTGIPHPTIVGRIIHWGTRTTVVYLYLNYPDFSLTDLNIV